MDIKIPMTDLVLSLSRALDTISPFVADHGLRVAYIAVALARELGMDSTAQEEVLAAGALHDIGVIRLEERIELHQFDAGETEAHTELGFQLLKLFEPFSHVATIVRHHHEDWSVAGEVRGDSFPLSSHVIHLADRMSVLPKNRGNILDQAARIREAAVENSGRMFCPDAVDAFRRVSEREYFWFDLSSPSLNSLLSSMPDTSVQELRTAGLLELGNLFAHVIDFRSHFTATHSTGVAATAEALARICGYPEEQCEMMRVAGYLHDIGKLAVPVEILEKPSKLSEQDRNIIMVHPYHSHRILKPIPGLDIVNSWGSLHHERVDGSGYPFHLEEQELSAGSRLMAVADVFTAVSEDRPHRKGMAPESVKRLLRRMSEMQKLDAGSVGVLMDNFDEICSVRRAAQAESAEIYARIRF